MTVKKSKPDPKTVLLENLKTNVNQVQAKDGDDDDHAQAMSDFREVVREVCEVWNQKDPAAVFIWPGGVQAFFFPPEATRLERLQLESRKLEAAIDMACGSARGRIVRFGNDMKLIQSSSVDVFASFESYYPEKGPQLLSIHD